MMLRLGCGKVEALLRSLGASDTKTCTLFMLRDCKELANSIQEI